MEIRELDADGVAGAIEDLSEILVDCVAGGASVNFMWPFEMNDARPFWRGVVAAVRLGRNRLFVAEDDEGRVSGTVQLAFAQQPNQPHRAEITKMLVHRRARRRGLADALMAAAESAALDCGRTLLVLDTASEDAKRVYERRAWVPAGTIPQYALNPDGTPCDTVIYWKRLG